MADSKQLQSENLTEKIETASEPALATEVYRFFHWD